jgi:diadenosine tetraphosphate (Ap4A) HIT family hydrolase
MATDQECEFCRQVETREGVLWASEHVIVRLGRPHHKAHTEVVFVRHEEDLTALTDEERDAFFDDMIYVAEAVKRVLKPEVLNYQLLGNWVPHLHWHIYPRFSQDPDFGNPISIPLRGEAFEPQLPSEHEVEALRQELRLFEGPRCPHCRRRARGR